MATPTERCDAVWLHCHHWYLEATENGHLWCPALYARLLFSPLAPNDYPRVPNDQYTGHFR